MYAVTLMIKSFFDKNEWKYDLKQDEDRKIDVLNTGFTLSNESVSMRVIVYRENDIYQVAATSDSTVPLSSINGGLRAINEFNGLSRAVGGYLDPDKGDIVFFKGTNTDGLTFSEEAFCADMELVMRVTDQETAQIIKKAIKYEPFKGEIVITPPEPPKKRNFFSRLFGK